MFSFIKQDETMPNTWTMHQLMRKSLMDQQEEIILTKIRTVLFEYYNERLKNMDAANITDEHRRCFEEAYYHGKMILKIDKFAEWFTSISALFYYPLEWDFMVPFVQDMLGLIEDAIAAGHPDTGAALHNLYSIGTIVEDMNFDGFDDVRIQAFFPPGPNIPYLCYLWDNHISKFVVNTDLERIPDPRFDHENKTIKSFVRDNVVTYYESIYKYINGIPTLVRETKLAGDIERGLLHTTIRVLKDGEMQIVKEYEEKVDIDS
jgi:hypothetical protein